MSAPISKLERLRKENPRLYQAVADDQYAVMTALNKRTGQVKIGGKVRFVDVEDRKPAFYTKEDMSTILGHLKVLNWDGEEMPAFRWWLAQNDRRQFSEVVFEPDLAKAPKEAYNLFSGFAVAPKPKPGGWSIFADHLERNICGNDPGLLSFLLDAFAHLFQRPGVKIGVAVVLYGDKGSGKSIVGDILANCIGPDYCPMVDTVDGLTQKHNAHLARAVLVRVEEAVHPKDPRAGSRIKHLITGGRLLIEPKGVDAFEIDSKANFIFTTNKRHVVAATGAERRYFCLHVANHNQQDGPFFLRMLNQMADGGYGAFVAEMMERDIRHRDFSRPPATALLSTQIVESMTGLEKWWCATLASGRLPFIRDPEADERDLEWPDDGPWTAPKALIQESASAYARDYAGPPTAEAVGKFLAANVPGLEKSRRQQHGRREHVYILPGLESCRAAFVDARPGLLLEHVRDVVPEAQAVPASAHLHASSARRVVPLRSASA